MSKTRKPEATLVDLKPITRRIYVVVAKTVQVPLVYEDTYNSTTKKFLETPKRTEDTKTVVQPAGRLMAQTAHVVSKTRMAMMADMLYSVAKAGKKNPLTWEQTTEFTPITTIILAARDSFELSHVYNLLSSAEVPVHHFMDTEQPDYGNLNTAVVTAIATEPVQASSVVGILDYLPLWSPE